MTTTVKRGAGRPAAAEKTNRHAQRTPLPPKAGVVEDAREVIASTSQPYGDMTVAQLRVVARHLLVEGSRSMRRGDLLNAILEAEKAAAKAQTPERVKRAEAKVTQALTKDPKAAAIDAAFDVEPQIVCSQTASKSEAKAEAFAQASVALGWEPEPQYGDADRITVTAKRGDESIDIEWIGGVFQDNCTYHHAGRTAIKLRNASAAKQRMAVPPAKAHEEAQKVTAHKSARPKAGKAPSATRKLPFTNASLDQEVLDALYGREITWTNRISGTDETERVPALAEVATVLGVKVGVKKQSHAPRITEGPDGRVIEFVGAAGFKTVLLSQITRVR